eukprot:4575255-Pleurochrysis_carterae.AAC.2
MTVLASSNRPNSPPRLLRTPAVQALHQDGQHEEALRCINSILAEAQATSGRHSLEAANAAGAAARLCNELALASMQRGTPAFSLDASYAYLQHAMHMPLTNRSLQAVTLNNLSIYYVRTGHPHRALRCLHRVLRQGPLGATEDSVQAHAALNLTSVLADLGRHEEALEMAQHAVRLLEQNSNGSPDPSLMCAPCSVLSHIQRKARYRSRCYLGQVSSFCMACADLLHDFALAPRCAAYHNLAVQQERFGSTRGYVLSYRHALLQAKRSEAARSSQMYSFIQDAYTQAKQRVERADAVGRNACSRSNSDWSRRTPQSSLSRRPPQLDSMQRPASVPVVPSAKPCVVSSRNAPAKQRPTSAQVSSGRGGCSLPPAGRHRELSSAPRVQPRQPIVTGAGADSTAQPRALSLEQLYNGELSGDHGVYSPTAPNVIKDSGSFHKASESNVPT